MCGLESSSDRTDYAPSRSRGDGLLQQGSRWRRLLDSTDRFGTTQKAPTLKVHLILPQEGQADKWSNIAQERYRSILEQADSDGCMIDRNRWLVGVAGSLLAVYNSERRGGSAATIQYAQKLGKNLWSLTLLLLILLKLSETETYETYSQIYILIVIPRNRSVS